MLLPTQAGVRHPLRVSPTVAVVEDDSDLRRMLDRGLRAEGFEVTLAATGGELLAAAERYSPEAFVVDIGLPDSDGRDVVQALRARGVTRPVIFLTARGALTDRLSGFHAGGDDYLVKPFALKELVVRLRALMRRAGDDEDGGGRKGGGTSEGLRLDPATHAAAVGDTRVALTPTEYRLLAALAARPGQVVRRHELVAAGWPEGAIVHDNTLDAYVARLRRKLREVGHGEAIGTARGVGYRLG
jgi:two-component system response regulator MprA